MKLQQISPLSVQGTSPKDGQQGLKEELFRTQFKKTQLCRFYIAGKKCKKGESCVFAHGAPELSVVPDLNKTSLCTAWMAWKCNKSSAECKFAHGSRELHRTPLFKASQLGKTMPKSRAGLGTPDSNEVNIPGPCPTSLKLSSPPMLASPPMADTDDVDTPFLRWISKSTSPLTSDIDQAYSRHSYVKLTPVIQSSLHSRRQSFSRETTEWLTRQTTRSSTPATSDIDQAYMSFSCQKTECPSPATSSFSRQTTECPSPATSGIDEAYMSFSRQTTAWPSPATSDIDQADTPTQSDIDQADGFREAEAPPQPLPAHHWLLSGMAPLITSASMQQRHMLAEMLQSASPEYYED